MLQGPTPESQADVVQADGPADGKKKKKCNNKKKKIKKKDATAHRGNRRGCGRRTLSWGYIHILADGGPADVAGLVDGWQPDQGNQRMWLADIGADV